MDTSNLLLEECINDSKSKGKKRLVILSSKKKMGFLSDPKYLKYKGFETADVANPGFEIIYLSFDNKVDKPRFKPHIKEPKKNVFQHGFSLYYTSQCPFTIKYVPLLENIAKSRDIEMQSIDINTREQAQNALSPFITFNLFDCGKFVTHEILSEKI